MAELNPTAPLTLAETIRLQEIEGNPLTPDEIETLEMFEREGWDANRRTAHILEQISSDDGSQAAE